MLSDTPNCNPKALSISRRRLLCAGGAGFVSTLIGTLVGTSRTARAQALGSQVPEVDRLAVRIVTDNQVIQFVPSEKREGLAIERIGGNQTPNAPPRTALNGEWGLSMHAESRRGNELRNILIDFGYTPETLLNNMSILRIDPSTLDALVLSHGHYDHFGGMVRFLSANKGKLRKKLPFFVGGEDCFCSRTSANGGQFGALDRKAITEADLSLMMAEGPAIVADHAFTTGKIAQVSSEKPLQSTREKVGIVNGFGCFPDKMSPAKNTGDFIPDDFEHEIGTNFVIKGKGLVVLTSCSHRGIINTIRQAQVASGLQKVHAVIGGFHIVPPLDDTYIRQVVATLKKINPDYLIPGHCSGERFYDLARNELGDKVIHSAVGTRFVFGA
jgi:7,8-dihydropterin-6-yl-methyl-4-(beta-D-ribofuranosyl)aminobenzene 5'-phosphate synthase